MIRPGVRQFEVTHYVTGTVTRVCLLVREISRGAYERAGSLAGHRYPADCLVQLVPVGQEIPLAFDEIPLVLRRKG